MAGVDESLHGWGGEGGAGRWRLQGNLRAYLALVSIFSMGSSNRMPWLWASNQARGRCMSGCKNFGRLGEHGSKLCNPETKSPLIAENEIRPV